MLKRGPYGSALDIGQHHQNQSQLSNSCPSQARRGTLMQMMFFSGLPQSCLMQFCVTLSQKSFHVYFALFSQTRDDHMVNKKRVWSAHAVTHPANLFRLDNRLAVPWVTGNCARARLFMYMCVFARWAGINGPKCE